MNVSRRGFLGLFAGAVATAAASGAFHLVEPDAPRLVARHLSAYDIYLDRFAHRIDVAVSDKARGAWTHQYGVDFLSDASLPPKAEVETAIEALAHHIESECGTRFAIDVQHGQFDLPKLGSPA